MFTRVKDQKRGAARGSRDKRDNQIRVMLVDDDDLFLKTARRILDDRPELKVVATALDGETAVELARKHKPQVVLMDVQMEGMSGTEATRRICVEVPGVRVIGLSGHADRESVSGLLQAGAIGYVLKPCHPNELFKAVLEAAANRSYVSTKVSNAIVEEIHALGRQASESLQRLTDRERQILLMACEGATPKDIAKVLNLSYRTVENHMACARAKLGVHSAAELVNLANHILGTYSR